MILAIDFDGTIVTHRFPRIGNPLPHAFDVMHRWQQAGHKLILWTCRSDEGDEPTLTPAYHFCRFRGITFDAINRNIPGTGYATCYPKIYADVYIDDRSLFAPHPLNWLEIERLVDAWHTRHSS